MKPEVIKRIIRAENLSEFFWFLCLAITYGVFPLGISNYLTNFIPSYTPSEIKLIICIGIFPGIFILMATRSPKQALFPIIIVLSGLFGQYLSLHHKLCL